jgi:2-C-methyl-D-erythritol 4-phosphate cytidylyltransferase/2-C-methyl-D-erythritol 2,4-cyclodiphosphate synthase
LWLSVTKRFEKSSNFKKIIIVSSAVEIEYMRNFASYTFVVGGENRQQSLKNTLEFVDTKFVLVSDIARCCVPKKMIKHILKHKNKASCIVPVLSINDTLYYDKSPIDREKTKIIQTPQLSRTKLLKKALKSDTIFTDDSSAIASLGKKVYFVKGSNKAHKLTRIEDLKKLSCLKKSKNKNLVGFGIDIHQFEDNKKMFLCGVEIDSDFGFKAHSDGDVAIHAIIDALLGASGMGDIGDLYPDNDDSYSDIDSKILLKDTLQRITKFGFVISNIDITILAQTPKISPYKLKMRKTLSDILQLKQNLINIKASTAEKMGFVGRKEGVTVYAVANLTYLRWEKL